MQHITLTLNDKTFARANAAAKQSGLGSVKMAIQAFVKNFSEIADSEWHAPVVQAGIADAKAGRVLTPQQTRENLNRQYQSAIRTK